MGANFPTIRVHSRDSAGHPEITVAKAHITTIKHDVIVDAQRGELDRAVICTVMPGQVIKTTETYQDVLDQLEID